MIILALDLTTTYGSIALSGDGEIVAKSELESPDGFAHVVFPAIAQLLESAGIPLTEIDCFASASGPGAFTGVRVGLAAVKGLAAACGRVAAGISNLQALSLFGSTDQRAVAIDARRGDIFGALYDGAAALIRGEVVMKLAEWRASLPEGVTEFIVQDPALLPGAIVAPRHLAPAVARCAELHRELWVDPAVLDANYVRRSDAELAWVEPVR